MARPLRVHRADAWYHVTARGTKRRDIFREEPDRRHWLELIPELAERFRVPIFAYVINGGAMGSSLKTQNWCAFCVSEPEGSYDIRLEPVVTHRLPHRPVRADFPHTVLRIRMRMAIILNGC
jgi:hypothetical protein